MTSFRVFDYKVPTQQHFGPRLFWKNAEELRIHTRLVSLVTSCLFFVYSNTLYDEMRILCTFLIFEYVYHRTYAITQYTYVLYTNLLMHTPHLLFTESLNNTCMFLYVTTFYNVECTPFSLQITYVGNVILSQDPLTSMPSQKSMCNLCDQDQCSILKVETSR